MANPKLKVNKREITGRKVKQLRRQNITPGNIFGKKTKSQSIQLSTQELQQVYEQAGETSLVDLSLEGEKSARPVLISNLHKDPVTGDFLHVDFHQVDLTEKVTTNIPLEFIGEAPAVKEKGGVLNRAYLELEVEALPADLPENIEIDISNLNEIGDSIHIKEIKVSSKVSILTDPEALLVSIQEAQEEEPEPVAESETEEGETPEEGGDKETETDDKEKEQATDDSVKPEDSKES